MNNRATIQWRDEYNSSSSSSGTSQSSSTSRERSRVEASRDSLQEEQRPHLQVANIQGATSSIEVGRVPSHHIRTISSPYILQRFLTIESKSEPLRYEASIGILEGRVCEGEDMLSKKINEEGWEEVDAIYESISLDLEIRSEEDGGCQGTLASQIYPEAYSDSYSD